jgi:hypothetical protein
MTADFFYAVLEFIRLAINVEAVAVVKHGSIP